MICLVELFCFDMMGLIDIDCSAVECGPLFDTLTEGYEQGQGQGRIWQKVWSFKGSAGVSVTLAKML